MAKPETGILVLAANEKRKIVTGPCNYLYCYDQDALVQVDLLRQGSITETHIVERLLILPNKEFDEYFVTNLSGGSNTVRFFFGKGQYQPNTDRSLVVVDDTTPPVFDLAPGASLSLTGSSVTVATNIANTGTALSDVTVSNLAVVLAAADAGVRFELMVSIPESELNGIRVGGADVTATKGGYIPPGTIVFIPFESALYAIRDGANDVKVTLTALRRL